MISLSHSSASYVFFLNVLPCVHRCKEASSSQSTGGFFGRLGHECHALDQQYYRDDALESAQETMHNGIVKVGSL